MSDQPEQLNNTSPPPEKKGLGDDHTESEKNKS